jgi:hypothetical protein
MIWTKSSRKTGKKPVYLQRGMRYQSVRYLAQHIAIDAAGKIFYSASCTLFLGQ